MRIILALYLAALPQDGDGLSALVEVLKESNEVDFQLDILKGLRDGLKGKTQVKMPPAWPEVAAKLEKSPNAEVRSLAQAVSIAFGDPRAFEAFRRVLADAKADSERRKSALESLLNAKDAGLLPVLKGLVGDPALRGPAIRALAAFDDPAIPGLLLGAYASLDVAERRDVINTLAARGAYARELIAALRRKAVPRGDLTAATVRQLRDHKDADVDRWISEEWGIVRSTPEEKKKEIERYKKLVQAGPRGDAAKGRAIYAKTCGQCHTLFDGGGKVGPELTGSNRTDLDYVFHNILDPSAEVGKDYQASTVRTKSERIVSGIIRQQDKDSLTIVTENDTILIPAGEVDVVKPSEVSMMPEGLLTPLSPADVRDLVAYLQSPVQVPLPQAAEFFNGKDLAGWEGDPKVWSVENGEIVGKGALRRNNFLFSKVEVSDFRLIVEVKLVPDGANSGIQFRSVPIEGGEARGYQADVGKGWWGKIYHESGRGLLVKDNFDANVKKEDWNTYEILAVGNKIRIAINGKACAQLDDAKADPKADFKGFIAYQVHSGGMTDVRFRNMTLEHNPKFELKTAGAGSTEFVLRSWKKHVLTDKFYAEGAHVGDFNRDGKMDVVSGPFWYAGPDFKAAREYYPAQPFNKEGYSKNFFAFTYDFNKDGWTDILILGFPGEDASWYENPQGKEGHWTRHKVFNGVDNESPTFTDLTGDGKPEIVCSTANQLGYISIDDWKFHPVGPKDKRYHRYTHGLGLGDMNGDGRLDLLEVTGWWEQPADLSGDPLWKKHDAKFGDAGAQIYAYDVDGDGDNDIIGCLHAHGYGLAWWENLKGGWKQHLLMGAAPEDNKYGVRFSQPHAIDLVDVDGDGVKDVITGKRHFAHGSKGDKDPLAPAVVFWFRIVRSASGVDFVPYQIDDNSGVGTQVLAADVNGDKLPDVIVGNKMGAFVHIQEPRKVSKEEWEKAQPKPLRP